MRRHFMRSSSWSIVFLFGITTLDVPQRASFRIATRHAVGCVLAMVRELHTLDHIQFDEQRVRAALLDLLEHPSYGCAWVIPDDADPVRAMWSSHSIGRRGTPESVPAGGPGDESV
jgi:hypothetical protein